MKFHSKSLAVRSTLPDVPLPTKSHLIALIALVAGTADRRLTEPFKGLVVDASMVTDELVRVALPTPVAPNDVVVPAEEVSKLL